MPEPVEPAKTAVGGLIDLLGRDRIEAMAWPSAEGVAGSTASRLKGGEVNKHGGEKSRVCLNQRKSRIEQPRRKQPVGETDVPVSVYVVMQSTRQLGSRRLEIVP